MSRHLTWIALSVATASTAVRLRLQNDRRFQVTPLDLIVLFMALVVPSLPGVFKFSQGNALGIAKLIILFYSIEVLVSRAEGRTVWLRVAAVYVLAGLVLRRGIYSAGVTTASFSVLKLPFPFKCRPVSDYVPSSRCEAPG